MSVLIDKIITICNFRLNQIGNRIIYYQFPKKNAYRKLVHKRNPITAVLLTITIALSMITSDKSISMITSDKSIQ